MKLSKSTFFSLITLIIIIVSACSSGKSALEHGNYYDAVITSINRLRRNTDNKKSSETLRAAYPLAVRYYDDKANAALVTNGQFKWREVVQHYTTMQSMYDEIQRSPGALRVIPNPTNYQTKLADARQKAAEESYSAGIVALGAGDRANAKKAYQLFVKSNEYVPGYRDVAQKIQDARWAATVKVAIEPIPVVAKNYAVNAQYFDNKLNEYLQSNQSNEFVKFYKLDDAKSQKINPDHIVQLSFEEFSIGQVYVNEKESVAERDSVVVAYTYTDLKGKLLQKDIESPKILPPIGGKQATGSTDSNSGKTEENKIMDTKSTDVGTGKVDEKKSDDKVVVSDRKEEKPEEKKPEEKKPEEVKKSDDKVVVSDKKEEKPEEKKPEEKKPEEVKKSDDKVVTSDKKEEKPAEKKPEEKKPEEVKKSDDKVVTSDKKEEKPAENKTDEKKPKDSADEKSDGKKTDTKDNSGDKKEEKSETNKPATTAPVVTDKSGDKKDDTGKSEEQVTICHQPPGKPDERKTLKVPQSAVKAHLDHGDVLGECKSEKKDDNKGTKGKDGGGEEMPGLVMINHTIPVMIASASNDKVWYLFNEENRVIDTTKIYGKVKATVHHFKKTITSRGVLNFRIIDAKTKAVISEQRMPSESVWISEWLTYNGDSRALTPEQEKLAKQKELQPPSNQDLFAEFTKPLFDQIKNKISEFYKNY